jgi:hypothetical protein
VLALDPGDDLDVLGQRRAAQLLAEPFVDLEDARAVGHLDLDAHRLVVAGLDAHLVDGVGGDRVDVQAPGLELDARAALAMSSASATRTMPPSTVSGRPLERCEITACMTSATTIERSGSGRSRSAGRRACQR